MLHRTDKTLLAARTLVGQRVAVKCLPGFDLAMLHTQLGAHSPLIAAVLTRELRMHHVLPDGPLRGSRLPLIEAAWAHARDRLHQRASQRP